MLTLAVSHGAQEGEGADDDDDVTRGLFFVAEWFCRYARAFGFFDCDGDGLALAI